MIRAAHISNLDRGRMAPFILLPSRQTSFQYQTSSLKRMGLLSRLQGPDHGVEIGLVDVHHQGCGIQINAVLRLGDLKRKVW